MQGKHCVVSDYELARGVFDLPHIARPGAEYQTDYDLMIFPLGFEERALDAVQKLAAAHKSWPSKRVLGLVGKYITNTADNERHQAIITECLSQMCTDINTFDADSPQEVFDTINSALNTLMQNQSLVKVAFDISGASGTLILSAMKALFHRGKSISITIFYTEAKYYFPDYETYRLSPNSVVERCCRIGDPDSDHEVGVELVDVNELYPGNRMENRKELVVAIPSFRTERLRQCLQYVSEQISAAPQKYIYWIFGMPPADRNNWRNTLQRQISEYFMRSALGYETAESAPTLLTQNNSYDVSTLDYRDITRHMIDIADRNLGKSISLIHMGSKMQALGLSLALQARSELTVCYARPSSFKASRYSVGVGDAHCVNFLAPIVILDHLRKIGTLEFVPSIETDNSGKPNF